MTVKEQYSVLFVAHRKVSDRLFTDVCARYGAPGTPKQWFVDNGCLLSNGDRSQLNYLCSYLSEQMRTLFMIGHDYGWEQQA